MSKKDFSIGDVVRLNSGSPPLTVSEVQDETIEVMWMGPVSSEPDGFQKLRTSKACFTADAPNDGDIVASGALRVTLTVPFSTDEPVETHILAGKSLFESRQQFDRALGALRDEVDEIYPPAPPASGFARYRSHKIVEAAEIDSSTPVAGGPDRVNLKSGEAVEVPKDFFGRGYPLPGDFLVRYLPDGYLSWSPRDKFVDGYTRISED